MSRYLRLLTILVLPFAAARTVDLLFFTDWLTGFVIEGSIYIRLAVALIIVGLGFTAGLVRVRSLKEFESDIESTNSSIERMSIASGVCFFLAGFANAAASVGVFYTMYSSGELNYLTKTNDELLSLGRSKLYYVLVLISIALGVFVAFWFMLVGSWYFRGEGHFSGGRYLSIFVVIWFYIRVIKDFLRFPINPNNTTSLYLIISVLCLSLFYSKYAKVISTDFPLIDDPSLFSFGGLAFIWMLSIGAPTIIVLISKHEMDQVIVLVADTISAIAAFSTLFAKLSPKQSIEDSI
ncbi:MAG: hypothetical protein FWG21_05170 [Oscillospiraceae bacterium]|nr:hypothetical protein [Oscillospiraceae bacterium]